MGSLSKQDVMEAIKRQAKPRLREKPGLVDRLKGMLNPRGPVGALANREAYLRYVDEQQSKGLPALPYDEWARGK